MPIATDLKCDGRVSCRENVAYLVRAHQIDSCNAGECIHGCRTFVMCGPCVTRLSTKLLDILKRTLAVAPEVNGEKFCVCHTCLKPINGLHDILQVDGFR